MSESVMKSKSLMGKPVLILNGDYQPLSKYPLSLNSMKKVLKSLLKGRISVVKEYDDSIFIRGNELKLPKVVVLKRYINVSHKPKFSRKNVYLRDDYTCQYCGKKFSPEHLTFDHVVPRKDGGQTTWDNIVTCCRECNTRKGCKSSEEAHMYPLREPRIPTMRELEAHSSHNKDNQFSDWLSEAYWNEELEN
jgi:5-methylcytosine-specific restriction endonuclease McrA